MTEFLRRGAPGMKSVKDMPIVQDGPPPGGFPAIRYARRVPSTGPTGITLFAVGASIMAYGFYKVGQGNHIRRAETAEKMEARKSLVPFLQAEEDRRWVKVYRQFKEKENNVLKDNPDFNPQEPIYKTRWMPPAQPVEMKLEQRPTLEQMALATSVPPPQDFTGLGAWVEHIAAPRKDSVATIIEESLGYPQSMIARIFEFGGIYTCPIVPEIPLTAQSRLSSSELAEMRRRRETVMATATREILHTRIARLFSDTVVEEHTYIRVHCSPKRFPVFHSVDWPQRVMAEGSDYVILDKPAYLPVAPTVDNILESALSGAAKGIGAKDPLLITSRLDQATEGLIVLGKTAEFVQKFGKIIRGEGIQSEDDDAHKIESSITMYKKMYKALVRVPPPLGTMTHHVKIKCRQQGTPFFTIVLREKGIENEPKAQYCELIVHAVEKVNLGPAAKERFDPDIDTGYEVLIELVTGRTHQIRAQLSAAGCPLLGDDLYTPLASPELRARLEVGDPTLVIVDDTGRRLLAEADGPIGLQAFRLEIDDRLGVFGEEGKNVVFEAGTPWWRN
ncbi:hypothetical protein Ndes2526A_g04699 [Nannochloris sp. 'desiccata']